MSLSPHESGKLERVRVRGFLLAGRLAKPQRVTGELEI